MDHPDASRRVAHDRGIGECVPKPFAEHYDRAVMEKEPHSVRPVGFSTNHLAVKRLRDCAESIAVPATAGSDLATAIIKRRAP